VSIANCAKLREFNFAIVSGYDLRAAWFGWAAQRSFAGA